MKKGKLSEVFQKRRRNNNEVEILILSAKKGSLNAARASRVLGLSTKYIVNGEIIERKASGKTRVIRRIKKIELPTKPLKTLKRGMVICRE